MAIVGASGSGKSTLLHIILTVQENITLPCSLDGKKVDEERLGQIMKSLGIFEIVFLFRLQKKQSYME